MEPGNGRLSTPENRGGSAQPGKIPWYMHTATLPPFHGRGPKTEKIIVSENLAGGCAMREDVLRFFLSMSRFFFL